MDDSRMFAKDNINLCGQLTGNCGHSGGPRALAIARRNALITRRLQRKT